MRELLTNFGKIDILWFDFSYEEKGRDAWQSEKIVAMIRESQPHIILNNRLDLVGAMAKQETDVITPEQVQPNAWLTVDGEPIIGEVCQTLRKSGSLPRRNDPEKRGTAHSNVD